MNRLERLYAVAEALRRAAPAPVSAATLAEDFGVTRRTIERDLASLRAAGAPIYAERGRDGGQVSLDRPGSAIVTLSAGEVTALLVAVAAAGPDMPFADHAATAVDRLLDPLPDTTRRTVESLRDRVRTRVAGQDRIRRRIRRSVETAVQRGVVLNLDYVDRHGETTSRSVDAVGLYQGGDGWFLIGWCHLRSAGRVFRLDRIRSARLTARPIGDHDVDDTLGWVPDAVARP
ncbi:MAG: WYL domain-containing protein [Actinomycetota bacterium]